MHRLLTRQVRRHLNGETPESLAALLAAVDEAYASFDADRLLCERSLDISSQELMVRHEEVTGGMRNCRRHSGAGNYER